MALENRNNVQLIFFDISKAFDKVWHEGLLHKMRNIDIKDTLYQWFKDYLANRKQRVVRNGKCSSWQSIQAGFPQDKGQFSAQSFFIYILMTLVKILLQKHHYLQMIHLYQNTLLTV